MSFATVLCLIPENVYGRLEKITGNGLAAGCQLFYRKIYGYFTVYNESSSHKSVQKLFHNLFTIFPNSLMGFNVIFHLEKELLKGVSDVQELLF